jgi:hypothetical protein
MTRDLSGFKWAYDLASMLQVALLAYMAAGAFLPMTYFDLTYQLMALCAILRLHVAGSVMQSSVESNGRAQVLAGHSHTSQAASG